MFKNKNTKYLGIDIGDKYLKLSSLSKIDSIYSVDNYAKIDISEYVDEGQIKDPKKIEELIAQYIEEYNLKKPELIFSFPNKNIDYSQTKIFKMKTLSKKEEMKSAIEIEVEDRFSNSSDKLEWRIISKDFNSDTLIYATTYKEERLNEYEEIMKNLKYSYSIIPKNIYLNNLIDSSEKTILLVDMGYNTTDFIVYNNNIPIFTKTINIGGNSITDIIASFKSITYEEAERIKLEEGLLIRGDSPIDFSYDERELSSFIDTQIQIIIGDIERIVSDIANEYSLHVDEIKVCGGTSNIKYLEEYFQYSLDIPTEKLLPKFLEENQDEDIIDISNVFHNSFSLSFLSFKKPLIDLTLKNIKQENEKLPIIILSASAILIILMSSLCISGNFVSDIYLNRTADKLSVVKSEYEPFVALFDRYKNIITSSTQNTTEMTELKTVLDTIEQNRILPIDVLTKLKTHTPKNVQMDTFSFIDKKIEIEGVVSDYMSLGYFIKELELVDEFSKIDFEYANIYTEIKGSSGKTLKNLKYKITITYSKTGSQQNQQEGQQDQREEDRNR